MTFGGGRGIFKATVPWSRRSRKPIAWSQRIAGSVFASRPMRIDLDEFPSCPHLGTARCGAWQILQPYPQSSNFNNVSRLRLARRMHDLHAAGLRKTRR